MMPDTPSKVPTNELTKRTSEVGERAADNLKWSVAATMKTLKKMRDDPQIGLGLELVKAPIYGAEWRVECDDDRVGEFVTAELKHIWRSALRSSLTAVEFGFAAHEKLWEVDSDGAHIKSLKDLDPADCVLMHDAQGSFAGFRHKARTTVPAEKSFVFTHDKQFGNPYGQHRMRRSAQYWQWCGNCYRLMNQYLQRRAVPPVIGHAPCEKRQTDAGTEVDTVDEMQKNLKAIMSGGAVTLPAEFDENGNPLWSIELLQDQQRSTDFLAPIAHYETMKMRGILVPDRTATQGETGAYSVAEAHIEMFLVLEEQLLFDLLDHFNLYLIPQIVIYNFGPDAPEARVTSEGLSREAQAMLSDLVGKLLQSQVTAAKAAEALDVIEVLKGAGVPVRADADGAQPPSAGAEAQPGAQPPSAGEAALAARLAARVPPSNSFEGAALANRLAGIAGHERLIELGMDDAQAIYDAVKARLIAQS